MNVPNGYALVGSSNFTKAGLTKNIELNVQISNNVELLQEWFEQRWNEAKDITDAVLETIEKHCREYAPFDVYLRSIYELCNVQGKTVTEWEENESAVYPLLSQYQKDGYNSMLNIAKQYTYDFTAEDIGLKTEAFAKVSSFKQLRPMTDNQPFGIFAITFESKKLEVSALKKILSKLVTKKRNNPEYPTWNKQDLIFLCFWGDNSEHYIGFASFDDSDKNLPQLKIEHINPAIEDAHVLSEFENRIKGLSMPADTTDTNAWRMQWQSVFTRAYHQTITDSKLLATELANLAKNVKQTIQDTYKVETGLGYIHLLYKQFMDSLVHDLTIEQFADMYAQTIAYGLFSAKCMDNNDNFVWEEAVENIPNTNPFLKTLIKSCFEKNDKTNAFFDELELKRIIDLLDKTDIKSILEAFNRRTGGGREDTVIYFYEDFLSEYEHETKKRRGVYYTPWPIVKFMVRAVDDILKSEFGFKDGLADTAKKSVAIKRESKKKDRYGVKSLVDDTIDVPAIQILDPATGTGTFLREVILQIRDTFVENNKGKSDDEIKKLWNKYVPEQLLPRINGFELMMAPYAVAHMKLAMVLKETGYDFKSEKRLNVVLTNTLEPSKSEASFLDEGEQLNFFNDPLAAEAFESDKAKNNQGINVIIGIIWISIKNIKFKYIVFMVFIVFMNVPFRIIAS